MTLSATSINRSEPMSMLYPTISEPLQGGVAHHTWMVVGVASLRRMVTAEGGAAGVTVAAIGEYGPGPAEFEA